MTGDEIRSIRSYRGLTQDEFARLLGVHTMTVSRWERSLNYPTRFQLSLLAVLAVKRGPRGEDLKDLLATYGPGRILATKLLPR